MALLGATTASLSQQTAMLEAELGSSSSHNCNSNIDRIKMGPQNWE